MRGGFRAVVRVALVLAVAVVAGCGRERLWLDWPLEYTGNPRFGVQREGVRHPVHGVVNRGFIADRERGRILYDGRVVLEFTSYDDGTADAFWSTSSHLYIWFGFRSRDHRRYRKWRAAVKEVIARVDPTGRFAVCRDITPLQDRGGNLRCSGVADDRTFRFRRAYGGGEEIR